MKQRLAHGLAAGAAGTTALDVITYADMAIRGRPPSEVPVKDVERLAEIAGIDLGAGDRAAQRKQGIAALMGYMTGLSIGVACALTAPITNRLPGQVAAAAVGLGAMAATDAASAALGATDPRSWSPADWLSDIVPHLVYGAVTVGTFRAMDR